MLGLRHRRLLSEFDTDFGPRLVKFVGLCDINVTDAPLGSFLLDFGVEIDGIRHPLLPILMRLRERGGKAASQMISGDSCRACYEALATSMPPRLAAFDERIQNVRH